MAENDKRFQMGWAGAALMFGVALIINYFSNGDFYLVASVFFIGLGMILGALGYGLGKKNTYLLGFAGLLALFRLSVFFSDLSNELILDYSLED